MAMMTTGSLTLIIGSMMSSKSTTVASVVNRYRHIGKRVLVINHCSDTRYGRDAIITHDGLQIPCTMTAALEPILRTREYEESDLIVLEEIQFYDEIDVFAFCTRACDFDGKHVTAAGLQGDRHRESWPVISKLIPLAEKIIHLTGLCSVCRDGTSAAFTKRIAPELQGGSLVGGKDEYMCLCRRHYMETLHLPTSLVLNDSNDAYGGTCSVSGCV